MNDATFSLIIHSYNNKFFAMANIGNRPSLAFCLLMDLVGYASYTIPGLGEFSDIVWAPISAIIFFVMFGGWKGAVGGIFNFVEEVLPGTDFIPSFTIMWAIRAMAGKTGGKTVRTA